MLVNHNYKEPYKTAQQKMYIYFLEPSDQHQKLVSFWIITYMGYKQVHNNPTQRCADQQSDDWNPKACQSIMLQILPSAKCFAIGKTFKKGENSQLFYQQWYANSYIGKKLCFAKRNCSSMLRNTDKSSKQGTEKNTLL